MKEIGEVQQAVNFISDGLQLTPQEYVQTLQRAAESAPIQPDSYSNGGLVQELECTFARLLGKERAIFFPTGTLANHIALRHLAGPHTRVIVQAESHIYNDCGDCAQTLSGLTLIPLAPHRAGFTLEEVQDSLRRGDSGRVATRIGVISIESPVRRQDDVMFGYGEMTRIAHFARQAGMKLHLDGARLFVEAVHSGISPTQYAALFDTVYVSLSKCFNAGAGAILAGSAACIDNLYHTRRMFGGSLPQAWPIAAMALQFAEGFLDTYRSAWEQAEILFNCLEAHPAFRIERLPNGTHIVRLHVTGTPLASFRDRLSQRHIHLPQMPAGKDYLPLRINPSLNRSSGKDIAQAFVAAQESMHDAVTGSC